MTPPSTSVPVSAPVGQLIWTGAPASGPSVFALNNCAAPGTLTVGSDPVMGQVWQYFKPAGDKRCETHGIDVGGAKYDFADNATYYIGWYSKLSDLTNNNADFQWKNFAAGSAQDYPFVISVANGHASVFQQQPNTHGSSVWTSPAALTPNTWNHYVVGIHTSDTLTGGWIQLWFNGVQQTFADGSTSYACQTWSGDDDPKWGEYGAQAATVTNYVAGQKVGTSYAAVAQ